MNSSARQRSASAIVFCLMLGASSLLVFPQVIEDADATPTEGTYLLGDNPLFGYAMTTGRPGTFADVEMYRSVGLGLDERVNHEWDDVASPGRPFDDGIPIRLDSARTEIRDSFSGLEVYPEPPAIGYTAETSAGMAAGVLHTGNTSYVPSADKSFGVVGSTTVASEQGDWHVHMVRTNQGYEIGAGRFQGGILREGYQQVFDLGGAFDPDDFVILDIAAMMDHPTERGSTHSLPVVAVLYANFDYETTGESRIWIQLHSMGFYELNENVSPVEYDRWHQVNSAPAGTVWTGNVEYAGDSTFLLEVRKGSDWSRLHLAGWGGQADTGTICVPDSSATLASAVAHPWAVIKGVNSGLRTFYASCLYTVHSDRVDVARYHFNQQVDNEVPQWGSNDVQFGSRVDQLAIDLPARAQPHYIALHADHYQDQFRGIPSDGVIFQERTIVQDMLMVVGAAAEAKAGGWVVTGFDGHLSDGSIDTTTYLWNPDTQEVKKRNDVASLDANVPISPAWQRFQATDPALDTYASTELPAIRPALEVVPTGKDTEKTRDGVAIAYLAAPPTIAGLGQQNSKTEVVATSSDSSANGTNVESRLGGIFVAGYESPIVPVEVEAELRIGTTTSASRSVSETLALGNGGFTDTAHDGVLMLRERVQAKEFTVLKSSYSNEPTTMTIETPLPGSVMTMERASALSAPGAALQYDFSQLVSHVPGNPGSYPAPADAAQGCDNTPVIGHNRHVGQGDDLANFATVSMVRGTTESFALSLDIDGSITAKVSGIGGGAYAGMSLGRSSEYSASQEISFGGYVGNIPGDVPVTEEYDWRIVACRATVPVEVNGIRTVQNIWVAKYVVSGYQGEGPVPEPDDITNMTSARTGTGAEATFSWHADDHRYVDYLLEVEPLGDARSHAIVVDGDQSTRPTITSAPVSFAEASGIAHRWRVTTLLPDGSRGDPTAWQTFTPWVAAAAPTFPRAPATFEDDSALVFVDHDPSHQEYDVQVYAQDGSGPNVAFTFAPGELMVTGSLPPGQYLVDVRAHNARGWSPTSTTSFVIEEDELEPLPQVSLEPDVRFPDAGTKTAVYARDVGPDRTVAFHVHPDAIAQEALPGNGMAYTFGSGGPFDILATVSTPGEPDQQVSTTLHVRNLPPRVSMELTPEVDFGAPVSYDISVEDEVPAGVYIWNTATNTASYGVTELSGTFVPQEAGLQRYCALVTDIDLAGGEACATVLVRNPPPVVEFWSEHLHVRSGETFAANATITDDKSGVRTVVDYGNGDGGAGPNATLGTQYEHPGDYLACVRAYDRYGAAGEDCIQVHVSNRLPDVNIWSDQGPSVAVGEPAVFHGVAYDADGFIVEGVMFSTVGPDSAGFNHVVVPTTLDSFDVCVAAGDNSGGVSTTCRTFAVHNTPPTVAITEGPSEALSLTEVSFVAEAMDARGDDVATITWLVDGVQVGTGEALTTSFRLPRDATVCAVAIDAYGASDAACMTHKVMNRAPEVSALADIDNAVVDEVVTFAANVTDPEGESVSFTWYHNGVPRQTGGAFGTSFPECGHESVTVVARDVHGATSSAVVPIHVWQLYQAHAGATVDGLQMGDGDLVGVDQPLPAVIVPGASVGVCDAHAPRVVVGEHVHEDEGGA